MKSCRIFHRKCLLGLFNLVFMVKNISPTLNSKIKVLKFQFCGVVVLLTGFYLFTDQKKLLMSSLLTIDSDESNPLSDLKHPLFVYVAFSLTVLGLTLQNQIATSLLV